MEKPSGVARWICALGQSLEYSIYPSGYIEGPRDFPQANPRPHPRPDPRPKTLGACGPSGFWPWVWPRMWPWVCFRKIPRAFNLPRGVDWVLKGPPEGTDSPGYPRWLFHRLSFFLNSAIVEWDWTIVRLFNLPLGSRLSFCLFVQSSPREKRGESYPREFTRLSQLNPNQLWRELERMYIFLYFLY